MSYLLNIYQILLYQQHLFCKNKAVHRYSVNINTACQLACLTALGLIVLAYLYPRATTGAKL